MKSIKKTALIITIISLVCKFFGFGREMLLAYFFGTSYTIDAYLMASSIPTIIFGWLTALAVSFTPIYTDIYLNKGDKVSNAFVNNIMSILLLVSVVGVLLGTLLNRQIISIVAPGFKDGVLDLTSKYLYISIWSVLFIGPIQVLIAYLNCKDGFIQSNISTLVISITQIVFVILAGIVNVQFLIFGVVLGMLIQFTILVIYSYRKGYKIKLNLRFSSDVKKAFVMIIPIFISSMIVQINNFVDKSFASGLIEGSISALNYGAILRGFIYTVFSIAITTMIYPMLSKAFAEKDFKSVKSLFSKSLNIIIILFVPITIGAIILAKPAITFVFQRGQFDTTSTAMTTSVFIMYSISLVAIALRDVITKVFYSMQETKSILYIGVIAVVLNIIFNTILIKPLAHTGLALATSLSSIITLPLFFIILRKKLGALGLKTSAILLLKASISTVFMGFIVFYGYKLLISLFGVGKLGILLSIAISAIIGGAVYFILMIVMKVKEMDFFTDIFKKIALKLKH